MVAPRDWRTLQAWVLPVAIPPVSPWMKRRVAGAPDMSLCRGGREGGEVRRLF